MGKLCSIHLLSNLSFESFFDNPVALLNARRQTHMNDITVIIITSTDARQDCLILCHYIITPRNQSRDRVDLNIGMLSPCSASHSLNSKHKPDNTMQFHDCETWNKRSRSWDHRQTARRRCEAMPRNGPKRRLEGKKARSEANGKALRSLSNLRESKRSCLCVTCSEQLSRPINAVFIDAMPSHH